MMGITDGRKDLDFSQQMICNVCGRYGRYQVFMTYTVLSLFFIPCFKWNKHYYVTTSCCGSMYELDSEIGKEIERGSSVEIRNIYGESIRDVIHTVIAVIVDMKQPKTLITAPNVAIVFKSVFWGERSEITIMALLY